MPSTLRSYGSVCAVPCLAGEGDLISVVLTSCRKGLSLASGGRGLAHGRCLILRLFSSPTGEVNFCLDPVGDRSEG